jgi:hypothetical protein
VEVVGVELHVAVLPVVVQIGGSPLHEAPPLRHVGLILLIEDGGRGHHQVDTVVRVGLKLVVEVHVEELIVEVDNLVTHLNHQIFRAHALIH